jgi:DNA-binding MarR family transcriptional regulator
VQASSTTGTALGEQLFAFVRELMLDPGADHLRAIEENDLSVSQVRALMVLACAEEPVPGARLAERLGFSPAAVSRALDGLVRDGLAVRSESAEDRRVRPFAATDRGRELADELSALRRAQLDRFVERLEPDQREALASAMDLIVGEVGA